MLLRLSKCGVLGFLEFAQKNMWYIIYIYDYDAYGSYEHIASGLRKTHNLYV